MNEFLNFNNEDMKDIVEHHYVSKDKEYLSLEGEDELSSIVLEKKNDKKDYPYIKSQHHDSANYYAQEIKKLEEQKNNKK